MSVYKKRPELLDLLRRRGVSFTSWCSEFGLVSWDDVIAKCRELDVIAPDAELNVSFTQLPVTGFSPEVKEELKALVDEAHDKVERGGELMKYDPEVVVRLHHTEPVVDADAAIEVKTTKRKKKANEDES